MAYYRRKRFYKKRRRKSYRPWYQRKYSTAQLASIAFQKVKYLAGMINSEKHVHDVQINNATTSGSVLALSNVAQGDTDSTRTGNSFLAKSIYAQLQLVGNVNQIVTQVRLMIVRDNQQVGDSAPTVANILDASAISYLQAPLSSEEKGRFTVLHDSLNVLSQKFTTDTPLKTKKIWCPMNKHIRFNGTGASDIQKNGLYLVIIHDATSTNYPTIYGNSRLSFYDN